MTTMTTTDAKTSSASPPSAEDHKAREDSPVVLAENGLIAYRLGAFAMKLVPAPPRRAWIDETDQSFANRCLPMLIANQAGWVVLNDRPVRAMWLGGAGLGEILLEQTGEPPHAALSHFGHGILTFTIPFLFRTPVGTELLVRGPANHPKDAIAPLEGIVETDWSVATATMNWKFTRPNVWIEFARDEPLCMVVPQKLDLLEGTRPHILDIQQDPETNRKYRIWKESRRQFIDSLRNLDPETVKQAWQRHYFRGTAPHINSDVAIEAHEHRTRLNISEFTETGPGGEGSFEAQERLRRQPPRTPNPHTLQAAAQLCLKRMLATQKSDGTLGYLYNAVEDKWAESFHSVRQAGCAYALARVADYPVPNSEDGLAHRAAVRLMTSLLARMARHGSSHLLFIKEADPDECWGKLGATALTALAAQYSAGRFCKEESSELIRTLLELQNPDGSFTCGIGREVRASTQEFFPGEALLALAHYARRTKDDRASAALARAFPYYEVHFRRAPKSAFIPWQTDVWTRVASWLMDSSIPPLGSSGPTINELCRFVFEQVDWLLPYQHTHEREGRTEYLGGFKAPHRPTCNSATFVEAIILACDVAGIIGDKERGVRYREAALLGLGFLLRLQTTPEIASLFPRPELAVGAMTKSLESFDMRCDYDQHFLTACLTALVSPNLWQ